MAGGLQSEETSAGKDILGTNEVQNLTVHTGNILQLDELKRKPGHNPAEELLECLSAVVKRCSSTSVLENRHLIVTPNKDLSSKIRSSERDDVNVTLKVFVPSSNPFAAKHAVESALNELDVSYLDCAVLAWPQGHAGTSVPLDTESLKVWGQLEELVESGKIRTLGVSDMDTEHFIQLYNSAKVKPVNVQINLDVCCVVPPELTAFTKAQDILLTTHNDPREMLPPSTLSSLLELINLQDCSLQVDYICRYRTLVRCRGILQNKGYVVHAVRQPSN